MTELDLKDLPLALGSMLFKYRIESVIGRGGYAWVYQGHDTFMGRDVAIKILHRQGGVTDDMLRRGQAEAKLLSRLRHPNIVEIFDAGVSDERLLYIIMELLVGRSLFAALRAHGRLTLAEGLPLFIEVADAIQTAHREGAIHRDIKPENIFIVEGNRAKVLDFGIAKITDGGAPLTTKRDLMIGTPLYMSPEQIQGHHLTPSSDIYSFGLVMYEAFGGIHPLLIDCQDVSMRALTCKQLVEIPPSLESTIQGFPHDLSRVVDRCISKKASERLSSMADLAKALRACLTRLERAGGTRGVPNRDLAGIGAQKGRPSFSPVHSDRRILLSRTAEALLAAPVAVPPAEAPSEPSEPSNADASVLPSDRPRPVAQTIQGNGPLRGLEAPKAIAEIAAPAPIGRNPSPEPLGRSPSPAPVESKPLRAPAERSPSPPPVTPAVDPVSASVPLRRVVRRRGEPGQSSDRAWWGSLLAGGVLGTLTATFGTTLYLASHPALVRPAATEQLRPILVPEVTECRAAAPAMPALTVAASPASTAAPQTQETATAASTEALATPKPTPAASPLPVKTTPSQPKKQRQPDKMDTMLKAFELEIERDHRTKAPSP